MKNRSIVCSWLASAGLGLASLEIPDFFSDGMVLQQGGGAKIWGKANAGVLVRVNFAGKDFEAKAGADGRWMVDLGDLEVAKTGSDLTVLAGEERKTIKWVLVGEVWIASGQSNMEWPVNETENAEAVIAASDDRALRVYTSQNVTSLKPEMNFAGQWKRANPQNTGQFTAVGYYFAKRLREELDVPVGIIECAWGGMPVESFTSPEALAACPEAKGVLEHKAREVAKWEKENQDKTNGGPALHPSFASNIYHGMIAPIAGYGARGAIWYQGEANANGGTSSLYEELLGCLVKDWRQRWGSDLSFYWVQLANFKEVTTEPGAEDDWVVVQDEMRRALKSIPKSGMAVINDIGDAKDIHPRNKKDVGGRLARWALEQDYGKEVGAICGPLFESAEEKEGKFYLRFEHAEGLRSRDGGPLQRFEIAAEDGAWKWAETAIENGKVVVWHSEIADPAKVRYAWAANPEGANLINSEGLPASCFDTK